MVAHLPPTANSDGPQHFHDVFGMTLPSVFDQGFASSIEGSSWNLSDDQTAPWQGMWSEDHWQPVLGQDSVDPFTYMWDGGRQQQQWAAWLSSQPWHGFDATGEPVFSGEKSGKIVNPWTEKSLDPEKPSTPTNNRQTRGNGSESKIPQPVGSGRQKDVTQSAEPKKLPFAMTDGKTSDIGPMKLNLSADPASCLPQLPVHEPLGSTDQEVSTSNCFPLRGLPASVNIAPAPLLATAVVSKSGGRTASSTPSDGSSTADSSGHGSIGAAVSKCASMSDEQEVTTVMVRNVPSHVKQSAFVKELEDYDFGGTFDFCYLPSAFDTGKNKGYAFVNFVSETAYSAFVKAWHGSRRFNVRVSDPALNVSAAALQGLERNIEKWDAPRMRRVRNPEFRPFVLKSAKKADAAKANVNHDRSVPNPSRLPSNASAEMPPPPGLSPPPGLVL